MSDINKLSLKNTIIIDKNCVIKNTVYTPSTKLLIIHRTFSKNKKRIENLTT